MSQTRLIRYVILLVVCGGAYVGLRNVPVLLSQEPRRVVVVDPSFVLPPQTQNVGTGVGTVGGGPMAGLPGAGGTGDTGAGAAGPAAGGPGAGPATSGETPASGPPAGVAPIGLPIPPPGELSPIAVGAPPGSSPPSVSSRPLMAPGMTSSGVMSTLTYDKLEELQSAQQAKALLNQYAREQTPEGREKIRAEIRNHLLRQFKIQHGRRASELEAVEKRLAELRAKLKKRLDAQATIVERRLEQLISDIDGLGWNADEFPDNLFQEGNPLPLGTSGAFPGMAPGMTPGAAPGAVFESQPGGGFLPGATVPSLKGPAGAGAGTPSPDLPVVPGGPQPPAANAPTTPPKIDDFNLPQDPAPLPGASPAPATTDPTAPPKANDSNLTPDPGTIPSNTAVPEEARDSIAPPATTPIPPAVPKEVEPTKN